MKEYLGHNPDTTTEEFDQIWRELDPETKDVRPPCFPTITPSHPVADLGQGEQEGKVGNHSRCQGIYLIAWFDGANPPDPIPHGPT